ncbi:RDD family protein [Streptomyces spinoverrucosus]|uniref:RDD family protein n=1 Tax=Streptomyces spinoverrucosus TaxID=284043 RepID=UPI0018C44474|nr:RDD family protein [Streptomyces spinoverrucosus]MBG0854896.1 RDD family protein [Streptomyces spinoverrucosus]
MSTEPPPGSGGQPPEDDPFKKQPPPGEGAGSPYDRPSGGGEQPPPYGGGQPPPPGGPYGGGPYDGGEYPADPLAGMPPLADSGMRTLARLIDMVLVGVVVWLITWGFDVDEYQVNAERVDVGNRVTQSVIAAVLYMAYDTIMIARWGQTLGKKWLNMRVAHLDDGATPSAQTSLIRAAVLWIPFAFCCACIWTAICGGWSFFDKPYKQGLHDKAAKTVVVSTG